jgi:hypothetical protein
MNITQEFAAVQNKSNPISQMLSDPKLRKAYNTHYRNSKRREIEFNLSYEEWLTIWLYSGKLHLRGRQPGQFCMGRKGDQGAYEVGNVETDTLVSARPFLTVANSEGIWTQCVSASWSVPRV